MAGGSDVGAMELHAVVARLTGGLGGEPRAVKHAVEDVARAVAGEHAAGAVGAVRSRREPENHDVGARVAEGRHGFSPIFPVEVGATLGAGDAGDIVAEAWTETTSHDLGLKYI